MSTMTEEIQAAIQKNMPAQVAEEMQRFIKQSQETSRELERTKEAFERVNEENAKLRASVRTDEQQTERARELDVQEKALFQKELTVLRAEAGVEAKIANGRADAVMKVVDSVFRNTEIRKSVLGSGGTVVPGQNGNYPTTVPVSNSESITETQA